MSALSVAVVAVLAATSGAFAKHALDRRRARLDAARVRAELEELCVTSEKLRRILADKGEAEWQEGEVVLVEGRIVVDGDGIEHPKLRSTKAAALTRVLTPSGTPPRFETQRAERAATLYLETSAGRILLDGPITLANGSRCFSGGATHHTPGPPELDASMEREPGTVWHERIVALVAGDDVSAVGLRRVDPGTDYRGAGTAVLSAAPAVGSIRLGSAKEGT